MDMGCSRINIASALPTDQGCGNMDWEDGPADFPAPWGGAGGACWEEVVVQVPHPQKRSGPNHLGLRCSVLFMLFMLIMLFGCCL